MRLVLAVDPGLNTGTALYDLDKHQPIETKQHDFDSFTTYLARLANENRGALSIVSESFMITVQTAKNSQAPWSLELIGVMRWVSRAWCGRELKLQTPSQAKRFASDGRLRAMGFWSPGERHANDAARHLLLWLANSQELHERDLHVLLENP